MSTSRLEAFTDAIIAIAMTLLVIQIPEPSSGNLSSLFGDGHHFVLYIVSFLLLAVYWNNHHHLFQAARVVDGRTLWANNFFILSLSIFPFVTDWVGDYFFDIAPQMLLGIAILIADTMFLVLSYELRRNHTRDKSLRPFFRRSRKSLISIGINIVALLAGLLIVPWAIIAVNALTVILWVVPEKHFDTLITDTTQVPKKSRSR